MIECQSIDQALYRDSVIEASGKPVYVTNSIGRVRKPLDPSDLSEYGTRLRQAMESRGLSQADLSKATAVSQSTIGSAYTAVRGSSHNAAFARACGVDPYWLATGKGSMKPAVGSVAPITSAKSSPYSVLKSLASLIEPFDADDRLHIANLLRRITEKPDADEPVIKLANYLGGEASDEASSTQSRVLAK